MFAGWGESKTTVTESISSVLADDFDDVLSFTESMKGTIRSKAKKGKVSKARKVFTVNV